MHSTISNPRVEDAIRELRVSASTSDPIEAIVLFHKDEMSSRIRPPGRSPILRDLRTLKANAVQSENLELVDRIENEIIAREIDAAQNYAEAPDWIEYQLFPCPFESRLACCSRIAQLAERLNVDQASGKTYQGRLAIAQGRMGRGSRRILGCG